MINRISTSSAHTYAEFCEAVTIKLSRINLSWRW